MPELSTDNSNDVDGTAANKAAAAVDDCTADRKTSPLLRWFPASSTSTTLARRMALSATNCPARRASSCLSASSNVRRVRRRIRSRNRSSPAIHCCDMGGRTGGTGGTPGMMMMTDSNVTVACCGGRSNKKVRL